MRLGEAAPALASTATSGLTVAYASETPDVCRIADGELHISRTGTCTVVATQPGDRLWAPAQVVRQDLTVLRKVQAIDVAPLHDTPLGQAAPALTARATSGAAVTSRSVTPETCTVADGVVTLRAPGTCRVLAEQRGDEEWEPTEQVAEFVVLPPLPRGQVIDFPALRDTRLDEAAPALAATATSQLPPTYTTGTPTVCTVSGSRLTLLATGTCRITASQAGGSGWASAADVTRSLLVLPARATAVPPPPGATVGTVPTAVPLPGVPDDAVLTVRPDAPRTVPGVARVTITDTTVTVVPDKGFSGVISLPVTVTDGGSRTTTTVRVVVSPEPARTPVSTPATSRTTAVSWATSPNATGYEVRLDGRLVCSTRRTSCGVPGLLGPSARLKITALGNDGTRSTVARAAYRAPSRPITVASVYFTTDSAALSSTARTRLDRIARDLRAQGFRTLVLSGHTDSRASVRHNEALSRRRVDAVERYLRTRLGAGAQLTVTYHAYRLPAASNATPEGRAKNRRTDVALG